MDGLPEILSDAIVWAERQASFVQANGNPLDTAGIVIARRVGVERPELIRVLPVDEMPLPDTHKLRQAAISLGLLGQGTIGLTLGYSIFVGPDALTESLLAHECRHVYQFEQAGSLAAFITTYLEQIAMHGYRNAPMELDARMSAGAG
jgi:hypothetical protein